MKARSNATVGALALRAAAIVAAGAALRLPMFATLAGGTASPKVLWYDEAFSVFMASFGPLEAFRLSFADSIPGFFVTILAVWMRLVGDSTTALALLPFLASLGGIVAAFAAGAVLFDRRAGFAAAVLLAVNPFHVGFATELRVYGFLFLFATLSLLTLHRFAERPDLRRGAAWAAVSFAGLMSHYTFVFFFALEAAFLASEAWRRGRSALVRYAAACAAAVAAYLPQLLLFERWSDYAGTPGGPSSHVSRTFMHGTAGTFFSYFSTFLFGERAFFASTVPGRFAAAAAGALVLAIVAFAVRRRVGNAAVRMLAVIAGGGIVLSMAAGLIFDSRYFRPFLAPAVVLCAYLLFPPGEKGQRLAAAGILAASLAWLPGAYVTDPRQEFKYFAPSFARMIEAEERPGDLVLVDHFTDVLFRRYYHGGSDAVMFMPMRGRNVADLHERIRYFDYDLMSAQDTATLERLVAGRSRVWTVDYAPQRTSLQDPGGLKRAWLDSRFDLVKAAEYPPSGRGQKTVLLLYEAR